MAASEPTNKAVMNFKIFSLFLLIGLTKSGDVSVKQSLYNEYRGYFPMYLGQLNSLSGVYRSLTDCTLFCTRSPDCVGISFQEQASQDGIDCTMYKQMYPSTVIYLEIRPGSVYLQDKLTVPNAATVLDLNELGANCSASSTANASSSCRNLWDGKMQTELGTEWISMNEDAGGWVEVKWDTYLPVIAVFFQRRCWKAEQCFRTKVRFNDETSLTVGFPCDAGTNWKDCNQRNFKIARINQPVITNSINISCIEDCLDAGPSDSWGLQEVKIWMPV